MKIVIKSKDMIMWHWYEALKELGADVHIPWITNEYRHRYPNPIYNPDLKYDVEIAEHPSYFDWNAKTKKVLYLADLPKYEPTEEIKKVDYVFSASMDYLHKNRNSYLVPFGCPDKWFYEELKPTRDGVCFIGNNHKGRFEWLKQIGVNCYNANWEGSRHIYSQNKIRVMPPIIFADSETKSSDFHTTSLFEGMACNILTIAPMKSPVIRSLVTYRDQKDAKVLIEWYLKPENDLERERIAREQMHEVLMYNTWKDRMKYVLEVLKS